MSSTRPVPRNIDKPNRMAEYVVAFLVTYYGLMFLIHKPFVSIGAGGLAVYVMYKFTANKPEGMAFRWWYRYFSIGKMVPNPKKAKKFEI
ncbi:MAG: hypothetical protein VX730_04505 [Pseudomonadota bacterium]|nr:hypothetical protein [Pseudomonadota bacterium]